MDEVSKEYILHNINKIDSTFLGKERISKNLNLNVEPIFYIKELLRRHDTFFFRNGKNIYCEVENIIICINASSLNIITAHLKKEK